MGFNTFALTVTVSANFSSTTSTQAISSIGWTIHGGVTLWNSANYFELYYQVVDSTTGVTSPVQMLTYGGTAGDSVNTTGVSFTLTGLTAGDYYKIIPRLDLWQNNVLVTMAVGVPMVFQTQCAPPTLSASQTSVCSGSSVNLIASGSNTYTLDNTGQTGSSFIVNPAATTTYTVTAVTASGCSSTNSITITVNSVPTITVCPDPTICHGTSTVLSASGATTYSWLPATGLSNATSASPTSSATSTTVYTVTGTTGGCSNTATVTVNVTGISLNTGSNVTICQGGSTTLSSSNATVYSWSPTNGLSDPTIANPVANPNVTTVYTVTGINGSCTAKDSVKVNVNVNNTNATLTVPSSNPCKIAMNHTVTLSGSPALGVFSVNGNPLSGTSLDLSTIPAGNTVVDYTVTNTYGCTKTVSASFVNDSAPIVYSSTAPVGTTSKSFDAKGAFIDDLKVMVVGSSTIYSASLQNMTSASFNNLPATLVPGSKIKFLYGGVGTSCFTDQEAVSVQEVVKNEDVYIYPNPFVSVLHIGVPFGEYKITITNMLGQVVQDLSAQGDNFEVEKGDLSPGKYFVTIVSAKNKDGKSSTVVKPIVVQ